MAESETEMLCFSRAEQRELYLALGLRVSALSQVAAADIRRRNAPSRIVVWLSANG
jgi:hypothetical protein